MTNKVNPSINRPAEAFKTAGAIAYGGYGDSGFVVSGDNPTEIAVQDAGISEENLNEFQEIHTSDSLEVTIDPGESFIFGSWVCIDTQTTVTLPSNAKDEVVYVGWNKDGTDDVIIGRPETFNNSSGNTDMKIPLWEFQTNDTGVKSVSDLRTVGTSSEVENLSVSGPAELSDVSVTGDNFSVGGIDVLSSDSGAFSNSSVNALTAIGDGVSFGGYPLTNEDIAALSAFNTDDSFGAYPLLNADVAALANFTSGDVLGGYPLLNADIAALSAFSAGDSFSGYPLVSEDLSTDSVGSSEIDETATITWDNEQTFSGGITGLPEPTADSDAARKQYVDALEQGLDVKESVAVSNHDANIDLSSSTDPNPVDGYTLSDGERILLKHQDDATENGIYDAVTATDPTTWVRSSDIDTSEEAHSGAFTFVENGTHSDEAYVQTTQDPVLGTDPLNFSLFARAGEITAGVNLSKDGSTINVDITDDETLVFGTDGDMSVRYSTSSDSFRIQDETNNVDRLELDRSTGDLNINGQITENSSL